MDWGFTGGLPETRCGAGSTLATASHLRERLPELLDRCGVSTLLDAPCGDLNWISDVDLNVHYIGVDSSEANIAQAMDRKESMRAKSVRLLRMDLLQSPLPRAGAVLCRDFLQHLPFQDVVAVLRKFLDARMRWFFLTSHASEHNDDIAHGGLFRPLNLLLPPIGLPEPEWFVDDPPGSGRILGVWHRNAIAGAV